MEGIWFHTFFSITLTLIRQFTVMCVDALAVDVIRVPLHDFLRSIQTFQGGFQDISVDHKALIFINENPLNLSQINLELHIYESDEYLTLLPHDETAGSSPPGTPLSSTRTCEVFVDDATKNAAIYEQAVRKKEANIQKDRAQETVELL